MNFEPAQPQERAVQRAYTNDKEKFQKFLRTFNRNEYMFLTNGSNHFVYYMEEDKVLSQKIPFHTVHWDNEQINWNLLGLNKAILWDSVFRVPPLGQEFLDNYKKFYQLILNNLVKYAFHPQEEFSEIFKRINVYIEISKKFSDEYTTVPVQDIKEYFVGTKNSLNHIINEISYIDETFDYLPEPWYLYQINNPQNSQSTVIDNSQSTGTQNTNPTVTYIPPAGTPAGPPPAGPPPAGTPAGTPAGPPPAGPPPAGPPPAGSFLPSEAQDVHGLMLNQLHDAMHDYMSDASRTEGFKNFVLDTKEKIKEFWVGSTQGSAQTGGYGTDALLSFQNHPALLDNVLDPVGFENPQTELLQALQEIESVHRPEMDMYYRYFYSRFIVHLFNSETVDFNLKPNFKLFMMQNAVEEKEDISILLYNKFVEACFFLFQYEYEKSKEDFIKFYKNISKTDSRKITGEKTLVEYFLDNSQNGGVGGPRIGKTNTPAPPGTSKLNKTKKKVTNTPIDKTVDDRATDFLPYVIDNLRKRFIPHYEKTYNHFLKAQQDVMDKALEGGQGIDIDEALVHQAIDIIMLNHRQNEKILIGKSADDLNRQLRPIQQQYMINGQLQTIQQKYIIDNAGGLHKTFFQSKTICCQSTIHDGVTDFSHACSNGKDQPPVDPVENNSDMNITIQNSNNLYIQYTRTKNPNDNNHIWTVTWVSDNGQSVFNATRRTVIRTENNKPPKNVSLEGKQCFTDAVAEVMDNWDDINDENLDLDEKTKALSDTFYGVLVFKSLGDILQELNCVLKYGGYINPGYNATDIVVPYDASGDARRIMFSNDRPSTTRILWYLYNGKNLGEYCGGESSNWTQYVNQQACGGWYNSVHTCFLYDPNATNLSTHIVYTSHSSYPPLPCHKDELTIGKYLTNYRSNVKVVNKTKILKHNRRDTLNQLYQVYVIICPNNLYIKINYLQLQGSFNYYSSIILNVINEKLRQRSMNITRINPAPPSDDGEDNYHYNVNDHDLMTIDAIQRGNYFIYKKAYGDDVYFRGDELIFKRKLSDNEIGTCSENQMINVNKNFYRDGMSIIDNPTVNESELINIKNFPIAYNNSLTVLNSELCQFESDTRANDNNVIIAYSRFIELSDAYSMVVTLEQDNTVLAATPNNFVVPNEPIRNTDYTCEDLTPSPSLTPTPPPVDLDLNAKIKFTELLDNIQNKYYSNELATFFKVKDDLKQVFGINDSNKDTAEISLKEFREKIKLQNLQILKNLNNLINNLNKSSNKEINALFTPSRKNKNSQNTEEPSQKRTRRPRTQGQAGGATEENMNPVIYAGVSILVLLGALTGLKM